MPKTSQRILVPYSTDDNYGLSFLIDAKKKGFNVRNIPLNYIPARDDSRIGSNDAVEKKMLKMLIDVMSREI